MMTFTEAFTNNTIFQLIAGICSIVGVIVGILAIIPSTRKKFFSFKQNVRIDNQSIKGSDNMQAGGNINNKSNLDADSEQVIKISIGKQQINGNNNRQAGGSING
jgi:hypothetical protein